MFYDKLVNERNNFGDLKVEDSFILEVEVGINKLLL